MTGLESVAHAKLEVGQYTTETKGVSNVTCKVSSACDVGSTSVQGTNVKTYLDALDRLCTNADAEVSDGVVLVSHVVRVARICLIGQCAFDSANTDACIDSKPIGTIKWTVVDEESNPVGFACGIEGDAADFRTNRIVSREGTDANEKTRFLGEIVGEVQGGSKRADSQAHAVFSEVRGFLLGDRRAASHEGCCKKKNGMLHRIGF